MATKKAPRSEGRDTRVPPPPAPVLPERIQVPKRAISKGFDPAPVPAGDIPERDRRPR